MSFVLLGILNAQAAGGAGSPYFIARYENTAADGVAFQGIDLDSSGNVYLGGYLGSGPFGSNDALIVKTDSLGVTQWRRAFGGVESDAGQACAVDSSGNVYIAVYSFSGSARAVLGKYDSAGNFQWQVGMGTTYALTRDVVTVGNTIYLSLEPGDFNTQNNFGYAKIGSNGTVLVERMLYSSLLDQAQFVHADPSENVYIGGQTRGVSGNTNRTGLVGKYNSSGTLQWQRYWGATTSQTNAIFEKVATDSSGNVYVAARANSQSHLLKYDSVGNLSWQRALTASNYGEIYGIAVDASNNIYAVGRSQNGSGPVGIIFKFDTSGNLQWQRQIHNGGPATQFNEVTIDAAGDLYVSGISYKVSGSKLVGFTCYLPQDGSLTGSYVLDGDTYVYEPSTVSVSTSSIEYGDGNLSSASVSYGTTSSSLSSSAVTLTESLTNL